MKKFLLAILFCCTALQAEPKIEKVTEPTCPRNIRVLLEKDAKEVLLEVKGPYYVFNPHDGTRISSGLLGKRFMIHALENGLRWGEEFPGVHQIYIKPRSSETAIFVNGIQYAGGIAIFGVAGTINIINDIDIEEYVKAVLTTQFTSPLEPEVLSALAILTRTDAYYQVGKSHDSFWQVIATDLGYQGCALTIPGSSIEKSVETTKNLILTRSFEGKNIPFATAWTENSAGKTAAYSSLFRKHGYAPDHGVDAPHAALARQESKWSYTIPKKTLSHLLDIPNIKALELFVDKSSNKVYGLRIKDDASSFDFDFLTLQNAIGKNHLQSSEFTAVLKEDAVVFSGFGKGHGVGLCLYSANSAAQNGENAVKILSKFFPETSLYNIDTPAIR